LESSIFLSVQPLLDGEHSYNEIKNFLIQNFSKSLDQRLQEILGMPTLGDLKLSKFLCQARGFISATGMSDAVLCKILMSKLPQQVQTVLSVILGCPMDEFARIAN